MYTKRVSLTAAFVLAAIAGQASAQVVDGAITDPAEAALYGNLLWVQNVPTGFGDNVGSVNCTEDTVDAPNVTTGIELRIPLSELGLTVFNPGDQIGVTGFISSGGHDFVSNQVIGGNLADNNSLGEPRNIDFSAILGDQFILVTGTSVAAPVIDGIVDAAYGASLFTQDRVTSFGDNNDATRDVANGSEIDGFYGVVSGDSLYVILTGNLATDFTKLELFIDSVAGGQNQIRGDNADIDFDALNRMGDDGTGNGLIFDTAFSPDLYVTYTNGIGGSTNPEHYASSAQMLTTGGGLGVFIGGGEKALIGPIVGPGPGGANIEADGDNSNIGGVTAVCPPPTGNRDFSDGSELDGLYAYLDVPNNRLFVLLTGNLQSNFNKLSLFLDVQPGGQNIMRGDNPDIDFNGLNRMGDDGTGNGLIWDTNFSPDYWVAMGTGNQPIQQFSNASVLRTNGILLDPGTGFPLDYGSYDGGDKNGGLYDPIPWAGPRVDIQDGFTPSLFANYGPRMTQLNPLAPINGLLMNTVDNSNTLGVTDLDAAGAAAVTTGIEYSFDLDELGWDGTSDIKIGGFVSDGGYGFVSNQVIGGLPNGSLNLGEPRVIDFTAIAGDQFINLAAAPCIVDLNGDGNVDVLDFFTFITLFSTADPAADLNGDGNIDVLDFFTFISMFSAGCP